MPPKMRRWVIEDPNNTWNHQLMEACLRYSITDAEALLQNGADPVGACEPVPFYKEPLPPLIALLLQSRYTTESVAMMNWLLEHGASVSQFIPLEGKELQTSPGEHGTILHLFVQLGHPAFLLDLLILVGEPRPVPGSIKKRLTRPDRPITPGMSTFTTGTGTKGSATRGAQGSPSGSSGKRGPHASRMTTDAAALQASNSFADPSFHLGGDGIDFEARTSVNGWTAMDLALRCGDATMVQLLLYYGAPGVFHRLVNGIQTALARACATGDKELVELLLDAGDTIGQISLDGRYTLIHYAAGQPAILDVLMARGLSIDAVNALGETALVSLICYGQGNNGEHSIREAPRSSDAAKLAALPTPALHNYILTPMPPIATPPMRQLKSASSTSAGIGTDMDFPRMTLKADSWWYFASNCSTWTMIQNLCDRGADVHGDAPRGEEERVEERSVNNRCRASGVARQLYLNPSASTSQLPSEQSGSSTNVRFNSSSAGMSAVDIHAEGQINEKNISVTSIQFVTYMTPLMHAIVAYHPELIRRLAVEYHADPMVRDAKGACALHYAAIARNPSVMELLLSPLVLPGHAHFDINAQDCLGRTPLHYAAACGNSGVVRALLKSSSSLIAGRTDYAGRTPLHLAVLAGEANVVELLLRLGETGATESQSTVSATSTRKKSIFTKRKARHSSINEVNASDHATVIDVEAEDRLANQTALEMAVYVTCDAEIARLLLTAGYASARRPSGLPTGGSLLHRVVVDGTMDILLLLLENYVDPDEVDNLEQTTLHLAAQSNLPQACEMVRELLRFGATPEVRSGCTLETPILIAARRGDACMLDLLLHQQEEFTTGRPLFLHGAKGTQRERLRPSPRLRPNMSPPLNRRNGRQQQKQAPSTQSSVRRGRQKQQQITLGSASLTSDFNDNSIIGVAANNSNSNINPIGITDLRRKYSIPTIAVSGSTTVEAGESFSGNVESEGQKMQLLKPQHLLITDGRVRTALHYLCAHSEASKQAALLPIIQEILGCSIASTLVLQLDADGRLPLHDACAAGYAAAVIELLKRDDGSCALHLDSRGCLPLHYAVLANDAVSITALVQSVGVWLPCTLKGSTCAMDDDRLFPITDRILQQGLRSKNHCEQGDIQMSSQQYPHRHGMNPLCGVGRCNTLINTPWEYLNVPDDMGRTPMLLAAELGHIKASKALVQLMQVYSKSRH
ncbi:hypothetical protein MOQ_000740 [Trypanosoma cruzi marinkellei]|uniref:Ankyrin repeat protein n=1 Tax=Trypanosoma cruzi marinkellei TaxID=85056 RepID=K2MUZ6_TRYCR|nr:hypothetical protein MOQ_000740 [Trypanosoma cruzi marinkellei]